MPKSNKKRKREQKVRSPPSSKDLQLDQKKSEAAVFRKGIDVDDTKREKHREKTTKKSAENCEKKQTSGKVDDKDSCNGEINTIEPATTLTSDGQQQQNEHTLDDSAKKKKKKKKKRKIRQVRSSSTVILSNSKSNGSYSGGDVDSHNGKIGDHNKEDEPVLEGSMVSDVLVLIDRKTGRVFSATEERLKNGERKQVGCLDGKGQVELFQKPEERENDALAFSNSSNANVNINDSNSDPSSEFPYEVDPDDHCESPLEAYKDIVPLLESYRCWIRKQSNNQLSIYDPYFCNGRVARHLESLGFPEVYNRKEDCYKVWKDPSRYPTYDVFLTNPPYSVDHIEKLMNHVTSDQNKKKPWMLLMPNFVHKKDYFQKFTAETGQLPIYLVPKKRYIYQPPPNMRAKKASSTHKKSSPFVSMWYLWGGSREVTDEWYRMLRKQHSTSFDVARSKSALRDLRRKPKKR